MSNDTIKNGEFIIQKTNVIGTKLSIYTCWEPSSYVGDHRTVTTFDGKVYGQVGSNPDRASFETLPAGAERSLAVKLAYDAKYEQAYREILKVYPELSNMDPKFSGGQIEVWG